jgi:hypothetical protein
MACTLAPAADGISAKRGGTVPEIAKPHVVDPTFDVCEIETVTLDAQDAGNVHSSFAMIVS